MVHGVLYARQYGLLCIHRVVTQIRTLWLYNAVNYFTPSLLSQWRDGCCAQLLPVLFPPSSFDALVSMIQVTAHVILGASPHCFNRCVLFCICNTHIHMHAHTHIQVCTYTRKHTHTQIHAHIHVHTCASIIHFTHSLSSISSPNLPVLFSVSSWCTSTFPH